MTTLTAGVLRHFGRRLTRSAGRLRVLAADTRLSTGVGVALLIQAAAAFNGLMAVWWLAGGRVDVLTDVRLFYEYAGQMWHGALPYRDFRIEYPPLAVPVMLIPRLAASGLVGYVAGFVTLMFLVNVLVVVSIAVTTARTSSAVETLKRVRWYAVCYCLMCPLAVVRFDLLPALLCMLSVVAWRHAAWKTGGLLAGVGALVKVFPSVAAIMAIASARRWNRRWPAAGAVSFAGVLVVGGVAWLLLGGTAGVGNSLRFQTSRGFEVESVYAGLVFAASALRWVDARPAFDASAWHLQTAFPSWVANLTIVLQAGALALTVWRMARSHDRDLTRWTIAGVTVVVVTSKVLSPQFLLWLMPLAALLEDEVGRQARRLVLVCCAATSLVFPWFFSELLAGRGFAVAILNLRNAALLWLAAYVVLGRGRGTVASA